MANLDIRRDVIILFAVALSALPCAYGQATAVLQGLVQDPSGSAIPGASVTVSNIRTGFERTVGSDADGEFKISNIPFQTYELAVTSEGFGRHSQAVALLSNVPVTVEVPLSLADQLETVEVSAIERYELLDTEATGTRTELNRQTIEKMPVQAGARGLEAVLLSFPGFAANANGAIHPRGAHNQMTYVIDGMPISDQFTGAFATSIDPSMVQSLELFTGDVPAEYGSKLSGVANITTRSGFDSNGDFFGNLEVAGGGFDTGSSVVQFGGTVGKSRKLGYFASFSGVKSNRFLDSPSLDNLHNGGNAERGFTRLDYRPTDKDVFRINLMAGRSSFQLANLRSQHANGQQQRRLLHDAAVSIGYLRLLSPSTTFESTTSYRSSIARLTPSTGDTPVTSSLARHLSTLSTFNRLNTLKGRHTLKFGLDFQYFPVSENFSVAFTDPAFNDPSAAAFNPNLAPFDLTRGGDWFHFSDKASGKLYTSFLQDRIRLGRLRLSLGARFDHYRFLVKGSQIQPRLGLAYHIEETGTVLRSSYNRNYQTPPNENLLLSNSQAASRLAPPQVQQDLNGGVIVMRAQRQNVYEAGLQQQLGGRASLSLAYFHKDSSDLQDNDNFLNTGIIFPTSLASSSVNGFEARLDIPEYRKV